MRTRRMREERMRREEWETRVGERTLCQMKAE
jgi:hypothetical protein